MTMTDKPSGARASRALITGASSGIGLALARRLAARGVEVWLAARREDELTRAAAEIEQAGGRAHRLVLDVADPETLVTTLTRLDQEVGGIDLVVANAGVGGESASGPVHAVPWEVMDRVLTVNLLGAIATLHAFLPAMLARGGGQLVGVSSIAADVPLPRALAYGTSKAGLTFYLEALDLAVRTRGVAVTAVHPGFVKTPILGETPRKLPFLMSADRAAAIIDGGIQRRARMVRFPWQTALAARVANALPRALLGRLTRAGARRRDGARSP